MDPSGLVQAFKIAEGQLLCVQPLLYIRHMCTAADQSVTLPHQPFGFFRLFIKYDHKIKEMRIQCPAHTDPLFLHHIGHDHTKTAAQMLFHLICKGQLVMRQIICDKCQCHAFSLLTVS